ncbi:SRPBCC family protein [Streptomyces sp. NPDC008313]|uniref:SRPBCC family protein n=1 Tax=Streptomyces sp. NPDC008313 TaxID=3364826 RepID=UPI0036E5701C
MYAFEESDTIDAELDAVWQTVSDVPSWATWDPHVLQCGFDEPFEVGSGGWTISRIVSGRRGYFKVAAVDPGRSYTTESPMPGGKMLIINTYRADGPGRVAVHRRVEVHGPFTPVFRLFWAKAFQGDTRVTFQALEQEARRRTAEAGSTR